MKKTKHCIALLMSLFVSTNGLAASSKESQTITGKFKYKHAECTGQNQWIYIKGKTIPIRFDTKKSDQPALKALSALLPEVLGPNSDGKITLMGRYETRKVPIPDGPHSGDPPGSYYHNFVLSDWRIQTPFIRLILKIPGEIPQEFRPVKLHALSAKEFNNCDGFDPKRFSLPTKRILDSRDSRL